MSSAVKIDRVGTSKMASLSEHSLTEPAVLNPPLRGRVRGTY